MPKSGWGWAGWTGGILGWCAWPACRPTLTLLLSLSLLLPLSLSWGGHLVTSSSSLIIFGWTGQTTMAAWQLAHLTATLPLPTSCLCPTLPTHPLPAVADILQEAEGLSLLGGEGKGQGSPQPQERRQWERGDTAHLSLIVIWWVVFCSDSDLVPCQCLGDHLCV